MRFFLALRAIFFVLLLPGTVAGYIPFLMLRNAGRLRVPEAGLPSFCAGVLAIAGAATSQFGEAYRAYRQAVPRWGFTTRPFQEDAGRTA